MAREAELIGRKRIAAKVIAAALEHGFTKRADAAEACDMNLATYRNLVTATGAAPKDEVLTKVALRFDLDIEELLLLRLGVVPHTGDAALDEHVALLTDWSVDQRQPIYDLTTMPASARVLVRDFVRNLSAILRAS